MTLIPIHFVIEVFPNKDHRHRIQFTITQKSLSQRIGQLNIAKLQHAVSRQSGPTVSDVHIRTTIQGGRLWSHRPHQDSRQSEEGVYMD